MECCGSVQRTEKCSQSRLSQLQEPSDRNERRFLSLEPFYDLSRVESNCGVGSGSLWDLLLFKTSRGTTQWATGQGVLGFLDKKARS